MPKLAPPLLQLSPACSACSAGGVPGPGGPVLPALGSCGASAAPLPPLPNGVPLQHAGDNGRPCTDRPKPRQRGACYVRATVLQGHGLEMTGGGRIRQLTWYK